MKNKFVVRAAALLTLAAVFFALPGAGWSALRTHAASEEEAGISSAPPVLISRSEIPSIPAGGQGQLTLTFQNLGKKPLQTPVASVSPSEGLSIVGGASSFALAEIPAEGTGSCTLQLSAAPTASSSQSISVELRFSYEADAGAAQGSVTEKLSIPVTAKEAAVQPTIAVSRSAVSSPISSGEEFVIDLTFQNRGAVTASGVSAVVAPSESLSILNETSTFQLNDLKPGKSGTARVRLRGAKEISSENQSLSVELRFSYESAGVPTAASQSDRVNIPAKATATDAQKTAATKPDAPVPNIVVKSFGYGGKAVEAGGTFPLSVTFENTGSVKCENIVMTLDGGESFTVNGGTNTAHYAALNAGKTQTQTLEMQAIPTAKSGAQPITVSFKYEYLDASRRASVTSDVRLTIPVSQPNRFQITPPATVELEEGVEGEILLSYVNKGKGEIANLEAELVGEGFTSPARSQYLGNVAAGGNGSIGFAVSPDQAGELKLTVKVSYEDADQKPQKQEFPLTVQVAQVAADDGFELPQEPEQPTFPWKLVIPAVLVVAAGAAGILVWRGRKKKEVESQPMENWDWSNTEEE